MATRRNSIYRTEGGAALDIYKNYTSTAEPLDLPRELPEEKGDKQREQKVRVRAKIQFSPVALVCAAIALVMLVLVIYSYVQLYETSSHVSELKAELASVQEENIKLQSQYEGSINLTMIEYKAKQLGMKQPSANQVVYLNITGTDKGEVIEIQEENALVTAWNAIKKNFTGILDYFF